MVVGDDKNDLRIIVDDAEDRGNTQCLRVDDADDDGVGLGTIPKKNAPSFAAQYLTVPFVATWSHTTAIQFSQRSVATETFCRCGLIRFIWPVKLRFSVAASHLHLLFGGDESYLANSKVTSSIVALFLPLFLSPFASFSLCLFMILCVECDCT